MFAVYGSRLAIRLQRQPSAGLHHGHNRHGSSNDPGSDRHISTHRPRSIFGDHPTQPAVVCSCEPGGPPMTGAVLPLSAPEIPNDTPPGTIRSAITEFATTSIEPNLAVVPTPNSTACGQSKRAYSRIGSQAFPSEPSTRRSSLEIRRIQGWIDYGNSGGR